MFRAILSAFALLTISSPCLALSLDDAKPSVILVDRLPAADKPEKDTNLSLNMLNCSYSVVNIADPKGGPTRMDTLTKALQPLQDLLTGKSVNVLHYGIYLNAHARFVNANPFATGIVGGILHDMALKCPKEKAKVGWYDIEALGTDVPPFVAEITVEIDGRTVEERFVYLPTQPVTNFTRKGLAAAVALNFETVTSQAGKELAVKLGAALN